MRKALFYIAAPFLLLSSCLSSSHVDVAPLDIDQAALAKNQTAPLAENQAPPVENQSGLIPAPILEIDGALIIVDKSAHRLYLYDGLSLVKSVRITTGKKRGDKLVEDDLKTPEGIYFLTEFLEDEDLPAKYGTRAIVLDYPNPVDKFHGKTGYGIWVHGTDDPPRLERPYDSRGCVVMLNHDVDDLSERIILHKTPVVIVKEMKTVALADARMESKKIREWLKSSLDFKPDKVEELTIIKHPSYIVVSFLDREKIETNGRRVLYLKEFGYGYEVAAADYEFSAGAIMESSEKEAAGELPVSMD